jgi:hypothetical protein
MKDLWPFDIVTALILAFMIVGLFFTAGQVIAAGLLSILRRLKNLKSLFTKNKK